MKTKQKKLVSEIEWVKEEIGRILILRPGSLSQQYNVCGKKDCVCKDKKAPKKHGPYNKLSYRHRGKNHTEFIPDKFINDAKEWTADYKTLGKLIDKWVDHSISLSKLEMKAARDEE